MTRSIDRLGFFLLVAALLLPVGDAPWYSFWREWTASIGALLIVLAAISAIRDRGLPMRMQWRSLASIALALALMCWLQHGGGLVPYRSDALLASLYFLMFAICLVVAGSLPEADREALIDRLAIALLVAALASVPMGVLQWIGWLRLDMNMPVAGGRPVAHMEQANLLCSLLIQGAVGAWRLVCRGRLTARMAVLLCAPILFVVVLTQSRVAWLVGLTLLLLAGWRRDTLPRLHVRVLIGVVILLVLGTLLLPTIDSHLGLTGSTLSERTSQGRRPAAWSLFLDAVTLHPWAGWGVLQNGAAQFAVADRHPSLGYSFSSAHNFLLDLIVWFGVPVGLVVGSALLWGVFQRLARASNASALVTAFAATALVLHASTELALHYAYFLFPLGLYLGATATERDASTANNICIPTGGRILLPALSVASAIALATIGREYIQVTDVRPALWVDRDTRHLVLGADFPPPEVLILDQLRAYHVLAALPLAPNVPAQDLDTANTAMRRTPFSVSIERYALLAGINGRDAESREALQRLCKFATTRQCERSRHAWEIRREQWPGLPNAFPASASD